MWRRAGLGAALCWLLLLGTSQAAKILGTALIGCESLLFSACSSMPARCSRGTHAGASHAMNVNRIGLELAARGHSFTMCAQTLHSTQPQLHPSLQLECRLLSETEPFVMERLRHQGQSSFITYKGSKAFLQLGAADIATDPAALRDPAKAGLRAL